MKNILIVTIGTRDVQIIEGFADHGFEIENDRDSKSKVLKKDNTDDILVDKNSNHSNFSISKPRYYGEIIDRNFEVYCPILEFPIIFPVIKKLIADGIALEEVWLVYTNQTDIIKNGYWNRDTLFFKNLIKKGIQNTFPEIKTVDYEISEQVSNIDFQYDDFFKKGRKIIAKQNEIDKIFLLPQGGIDQVNTALTLQFIQLFKDKLVLYQKAENANAKEMNFPQRFLHDLNKGKIIEHIKNYDFRLANELMLGDEGHFKIIKKLCQYAANRLALLHEKSIFTFNDKIKGEQELLGKDLLEQLKSDFRNISVCEQHAYKLSDLIYQCKICFLVQKDFNKGLILFFTLIENLAKVELEKRYSQEYDLYKYRKEDKKSAQRITWESFIQSIDECLPKHLQALRINGISLDFGKPNRHTYCYIFSYLLANNIIVSEIDLGDFTNFFDFSEIVSGKRNELAHNLGGTSEAELTLLLRRFNYTVETMFEPIDQIAGTSGFGIYEEIQQKILNLLDA